MFDQIQAYSGNIVGSTNHGDGDGTAEYTDFHEPQTAEEIIEAARTEAGILAETLREEAMAEREAILAHAREEAEEQIALNVTKAVVDLRMELFSARVAMGEILTQALDGVIGKIGRDKAELMALENAVADYCDRHTVTVRANRKTQQRLQLVAIGARKDLAKNGINLVSDLDLPEGRVILDTGNAKVEVSFDAQLKALKKVFEADAQAAEKSARSDLMVKGRLM